MFAGFWLAPSGSLQGPFRASSFFALVSEGVCASQSHASKIQGGHNLLPAPAGLTLFAGDVGISKTNTLFLSTIEPIDPAPFPRNTCILKIGDGLINGGLPGPGGCAGAGTPTVFLSPVMIRR